MEFGSPYINSVMPPAHVANNCLTAYCFVLILLNFSRKELKKVECISDGGEFVVGFCNENDIDIWNTRSPRQSDNNTVECGHR